MGSGQRVNEKDREKLRRLTFTDQTLMFRLLYEGFISRGSSRERRVSPDEKRSEARILRALKAISEPVGAEPAEGEPDLRQRRLLEAGGVLEVKQGDFTRLQKYIEQMQSPAALADVAQDLEVFLESAEKIDAPTLSLVGADA